MKQLMGFTRDKLQPQWKGFMYAVMFFVVLLLQSLFLQHCYHMNWTCGM